jgi:hypothetical protein
MNVINFCHSVLDTESKGLFNGFLLLSTDRQVHRYDNHYKKQKTGNRTIKGDYIQFNNHKSDITFITQK